MALITVPRSPRLPLIQRPLMSAPRRMLQVPNATSYMGCIGNDEFGKKMTETAKKDGVNVGPPCSGAPSRCSGCCRAPACLARRVRVHHWLACAHITITQPFMACHPHSHSSWLLRPCTLDQPAPPFGAWCAGAVPDRRSHPHRDVRGVRDGHRALPRRQPGGREQLQGGRQTHPCACMGVHGCACTRPACKCQRPACNVSAAGFAVQQWVPVGGRQASAHAREE